MSASHSQNGTDTTAYPSCRSCVRFSRVLPFGRRRWPCCSPAEWHSASGKHTSKKVESRGQLRTHLKLGIKLSSNSLYGIVRSCVEGNKQSSCSLEPSKSKLLHLLGGLTSRRKCTGPSTSTAYPKCPPPPKHDGSTLPLDLSGRSLSVTTDPEMVRPELPSRGP